MRPKTIKVLKGPLGCDKAKTPNERGGEKKKRDLAFKPTLVGSSISSFLRVLIPPWVDIGK